MEKVRRMMARHVVVDGVDHGLSIAEFAPDGTLRSVEPFTREVHSTAYVGTYLYIDTCTDNTDSVIADAPWCIPTT